jgi:hypothetical protein
MTTQSKTLTIRHAPGPYFYQRGTDGCDDTWDIIALVDQQHVATINFWDDEDGSGTVGARTEANARLLAASPQMLDALKEIVVAFERLDLTYRDDPVFRAIRSARYAVAHAEGTITSRAC